MFKKLVSKVVPNEFLKALRNYRILSVGYGQFRSMKRWECVDRDNHPLPWYTYPAIEYIKQLDFSRKIIFEFGSGNSTKFWASRCERLISIEDDWKWYDKIKINLPNNVDYRFVDEKRLYCGSISDFVCDFDVVIIDGSHRYECAVEALKKLKSDGMIILDNSDWKAKTAALLREGGLIEVDMSGFGPINDYTWTTSFFLRRDVKLVPAYERQPIHGIGSLHHTET